MRSFLLLLVVCLPAAALTPHVVRGRQQLAIPSSRRPVLTSHRRPAPLAFAAKPSSHHRVGGKPSNRPNLVLAALLALYITNQWARWLPTYLVSFDRIGEAGMTSRELMNVACSFDAQQYGTLVSYGFSLLYVACSFPAGVVCDVFPRKAILLLSALGWSLATGASAVSSTFAQVLGARVLLGVAQAFMSPAAYVTIGQVFPPERRATANAIYACGIYLGAALASLSVVLSRLVGWRATALIVAASSAPPALLLALGLKADGDDGGGDDAAPAATSTNAAPPSRLGVVLGVRSVRLLLAATGARFFAGFAIGAWLPAFYRAYFPQQARPSPDACTHLLSSSHPHPPTTLDFTRGRRAPPSLNLP